MKSRYNTIAHRQTLKTVTIAALGTGLAGRLAAPFNYPFQKNYK